MFENLRKALIEENNTREEETRFYIQHGYMKTWAVKTESDNGLQRWSTPAKWEAYKAGKITREKAIDYAVKRAIKNHNKSLASDLEKLEEAATANDLNSATVEMEWKRSSYWGNCPSVELFANGVIYSGRASGCGYDKASAAIAEALNKSPEIMKALYIAAEAALTEGKHYTRTSGNCVSWREILGYGSGYSVLPYFEGGVGVSAFETIFKNCGFKFRNVASGKRFDVYSIEAVII